MFLQCAETECVNHSRNAEDSAADDERHAPAADAHAECGIESDAADGVADDRAYGNRHRKRCARSLTDLFRNIPASLPTRYA